MTTLSAYYLPLSATNIAANYSPQFLFAPVTADLNGDGKQDLIVLGASYPTGQVTTPTAQGARVFFGDGNGNYVQAAAGIFPLNTLFTVHPRKVLIADFNGDGRLDFFISTHGWDTNPFPGEQNRLILSQANGTWIDATASLPQLNDFSHSSAVGDINGDGKPDIFVGNGYSGENGIPAYDLINNGSGQFIKDQAGLPIGPNGILDISTEHHFPGSTIVDVDGDGKQDLIVTADASQSFNKLRHTTILWNQGDSYSETAETLLAEPGAFANHIDLDAEPIDLDGDGLKDLVVVGTQGNPFYDGWFVQLLHNNGNRTFSDVTNIALSAADTIGGTPGVLTGSPWAMWVKILDFNNDGRPDFAIEYNGAPLTQSTPLVWLNDGSGHFTTLKVSDFVSPGNEWQLGGGHLVATDHGYSFVTLQSYAGSGGLLVTGLLATAPYNLTPGGGAPPSYDFIGVAGHDTFHAFGTGSSFDGKGGHDVVVFDGVRSQFAILDNGNGSVIVTDSVANRDFVHQIYNVEALQFADKNIFIENADNSNIARLYSAALGRPADFGGLSGWEDAYLNLVSPGAKAGGVYISLAQTPIGTLPSLADGFTLSPEFQAKYGALDNAGFVTQLYQNVLGRGPDSAGLNGWLDAMSGGSTRAMVLVGFAESPENIAKTAADWLIQI